MMFLGFIDWSSVTGILALIDLALVVGTVIWVLNTKREPTSALAWCLLVILLPLFGVLFFFVFGYQSIQPSLRKKKRHAAEFRVPADADEPAADPGYEGLAALAQQLGARPLVGGNAVELYHEGRPAYDAMLAAIRSATHHIHMQFFIVRADAAGEEFMRALAEKARAGVEVRFLYDAIGSLMVRARLLEILTDAGGQAVSFLPFRNPLRRRARINLRNHRKLLVVDGRVGFTGGLNLGVEYLGQDPHFGPWRDDFVRVEGPTVAGLQRVFTEDWDFAADEDPLEGPAYFPKPKEVGPTKVQVAWSGPDQDIRTIREVYFAAIMRARTRVWLTTPYYVPDLGLQDALALAARSGRDVRVLCPFRPDHWLAHLAGRYYWDHLLAAGAKVYQYTPGFLHTKLLMIDDVWSSVGSVNFDNRSLLLNFEVTCFIESAEVQAKLERAYLHDLDGSIRLDPKTFAHRPFVTRMAENGCRLLSPVL